MEISNTSKLLYRLQTDLSHLYLLFEGKWWVNLMKKTGVEEILGLIHLAHNELVQLRAHGINLDYRPFYSLDKVHRMFEDPMHRCHACQTSMRMRPNFRNRMLKKFKIGKFKNANILLVD